MCGLAWKQQASCRFVNVARNPSEPNFFWTRRNHLGLSIHERTINQRASRADHKAYMWMVWYYQNRPSQGQRLPLEHFCQVVLRRRASVCYWALRIHSWPHWAILSKLPLRMFWSNFHAWKIYQRRSWRTKKTMNTFSGWDKQEGKIK